jgi:hypothetical protein
MAAIISCKILEKFTPDTPSADDTTREGAAVAEGVA